MLNEQIVTILAHDLLKASLADVVRGVKFVDGVKQEKRNQVKARVQQVAA